MKLSEAAKKSLKAETFYYYEEYEEKWAVDFMFYMPRNDFAHAEEFNAIKFYKEESSAIRKAKELALKFAGEYKGRIYDMEI